VSKKILRGIVTKYRKLPTPTPGMTLIPSLRIAALPDSPMVLVAYAISYAPVIRLLPDRIFWRGNIVKVFFRKNGPVVQGTRIIVEITWIVGNCTHLAGRFHVGGGEIERGARLWLW